MQRYLKQKWISKQKLDFQHNLLISMKCICKNIQRLLEHMKTVDGDDCKQVDPIYIDNIISGVNMKYG